MSRILLLLFAFFLSLAIAALTRAEDSKEVRLPTTVSGSLVIFDSDGLRCVLYVNEGGMAKGSGAAQCLPLNPNLPLPDKEEFRIIRVVETLSSR